MNCTRGWGHHNSDWDTPGLGTEVEQSSTARRKPDSAFENLERQTPRHRMTAPFPVRMLSHCRHHTRVAPTASLDNWTVASNCHQNCRSYPAGSFHNDIRASMARELDKTHPLDSKADYQLVENSQNHQMADCCRATIVRTARNRPARFRFEDILEHVLNRPVNIRPASQQSPVTGNPPPRSDFPTA